MFSLEKRQDANLLRENSNFTRDSNISGLSSEYTNFNDAYCYRYVVRGQEGGWYNYSNKVYITRNHGFVIPIRYESL